MDCDTFTLPVVPPFRLDFTVWALRRRKTNTVDRWDGDQYLRVFLINNLLLKVTVRLISVKNVPRLIITLQVNEGNTDQLRKEASLLIQKMFSIKVLWKMSKLLLPCSCICFNCKCYDSLSITRLVFKLFCIRIPVNLEERIISQDGL